MTSQGAAEQFSRLLLDMMENNRLQCVCVCACMRLCVCGLTSICLWDNVGDIAVRGKGEVEHVGGAVLAGQRVKHLAVNSDLDVLPLCVAHLKTQMILVLIPSENTTQTSTCWSLCTQPNRETTEKCCNAAVCVQRMKLIGGDKRHSVLFSTSHCARVQRSHFLPGK